METESTWPEISAQLPPGHFIKEEKKEKKSVFISIFGCLEAILPQPSKRLIILRKMQWHSKLNLNLNGTLLNLIIRP